MLILPQEIKNFTTGTDIEIIQNDLRQGKVVEVSDEYKDIYPIDTLVVYSANAGLNHFYNGKQCLIIDCRGVSSGGDLWFIVKQDK
jgi:hypothetical protein